MENTFIIKIFLEREHWHGEAILGISLMPSHKLFDQKERFLHKSELKYLAKCNNEKKIHQFLQSRRLSKELLSIKLKEKNLTKIQIESGVFNQPLITYPSTSNPAISISHSDNCSACIITSESHPMGIDIEKIKNDKKEIIASQISLAEKEIIKKLPVNEHITHLQLWTAKEAISKVLKTGLMASFEIYETDSAKVSGNNTIFTFRNFGQYKAISFEVKGNICSLVLPKKTDLFFKSGIGTLQKFDNFDIRTIKTIETKL